MYSVESCRWTSYRDYSWQPADHRHICHCMYLYNQEHCRGVYPNLVHTQLSQCQLTTVDNGTTRSAKSRDANLVTANRTVSTSRLHLDFSCDLNQSSPFDYTAVDMCTLALSLCSQNMFTLSNLLLTDVWWVAAVWWGTMQNEEEREKEGKKNAQFICPCTYTMTENNRWLQN